MNHPVVTALDSQWYKLAAMIMHKAGLSHIHITLEDIHALQATAPNSMPAVVVHDAADGLHIRLMPLKQAEAYQALHEKGELDGSRKAQKV